MSVFGKLMDSIRLSDNEDDDYFLDEDYEDEKPARKGLFGGGKRDDDYYDDIEEDEPPKPRFLGNAGRSSKVVPMKQRSMAVSMVRPTSMEDSKEICDYLLAGKAVILNMDGIDTMLAQRIIDFTSGATYSMSGNLQKISNSIFIATPETVELSGDFQDLLNGSNGMSITGSNLRI